MLVVMTEQEEELWGQITHYWENEFKPVSGHSDKWDTNEIGKKQRRLMISLLKRGAIPKHRFKWLDDPAFMIGSKKSRMQIFCGNFGASDARVFEHPHWYSQGYLPFLVGVIALPERVIEEFRSDADDRMNNGYDMGMKYRAVAKSLGLPKKSAEEFFKLALDCGYDQYDCRSIRDIIHTHLR